MTFVESVRSVMTQPLGFTGRASRSEFWWFALLELTLVVAATLGDTRLHTGVLVVIVGLILFLPSLAVSVRRLHDTGRSGWWVLIELVPLIGVILLLVQCGADSERGENQYGPSPIQPAHA